MPWAAFASAIVGMPRPSAHRARWSQPMPHGLKFCSMFRIASLVSGGISPCVRTMCRRISMIFGTCSFITGHSYTQA